jgi:hypothetical protein
MPPRVSRVLRLARVLRPPRCCIDHRPDPLYPVAAFVLSVYLVTNVYRETHRPAHYEKLNSVPHYCYCCSESRLTTDSTHTHPPQLQ